MSWTAHGEGEHYALFCTIAAYTAHGSGHERFKGQVAGDVRAQDYDRGDHTGSAFEALPERRESLEARRSRNRRCLVCNQVHNISLHLSIGPGCRMLSASTYKTSRLCNFEHSGRHHAVQHKLCIAQGDCLLGSVLCKESNLTACEVYSHSQPLLLDIEWITFMRSHQLQVRMKNE